VLEASLRTQLANHLKNLVHPVELVAALDDSPKSRELRTLLDEIASLSDDVRVVERDDARRPSFAVERVGTDIGVRFAGLPLGHEFTSLVLAILQVGGHPPRVAPEVLEQIRGLDGDLHFETYFSLSCQICPEVVQALNVLAITNANITHVAIDGALFKDEVDAREVLAVPAVFLNGEPFGQGRMTLEEIVTKLDANAATRTADQLAAKEPYDVLVVGGGPAGAAAAVYAARKGVRTGVVAERFGGQLLDTLGIENLISMPYTEGPKVARELEQHVLEYDVDVIKSQRARRLNPADAEGLVSVELESGASLRARSIVVSTGARWRQMNVPGENEYRNRGVAYCPHCDGPLFKGKRVAVIGGGNSGVEAAIDLAGIVEHVTLIEFEGALRADEVLQSKLRSLANATVILNARSTEVLGDGTKVTGLVYMDRVDGIEHWLALDGIFVQIGLLPNTDWLADSLELSPRGEIVIDERGQTSLPGVFAAGDCTTVPYKQIVVAMGAGSTAALSAFDHLIRSSAPPVGAAA
jgi:alkyl hydroperoxide reductase subunit F